MYAATKLFLNFLFYKWTTYKWAVKIRGGKIIEKFYLSENMDVVSKSKNVNVLGKKEKTVLQFKICNEYTEFVSKVQLHKDSLLTLV